ncbi:hypothetical protein MGA5115_03020 [Marinomonas gallaica]|uniref:Cyclic nucleotide-binding domain protein n=1 Tax=Marinomonas gallaica TaxID=1806667 RepID=A0A1C3JUW4_9GAMM|nr:Crp/Fnr family transcriptional regulator [Marinomonas gallaica]MCO4787054.1 Crp/Fnr family transcriptional regulator [Marinomonas atlantica]SBT18859.1 hypothetical protein MGA5115_03020 [Marinomonas gallaica]SBT21814.1 hypothetical protein MGA5116_02424 [Marinomonas gallaica]
MTHFAQLSQHTQTKLMTLARPLDANKGDLLLSSEAPWTCVYWLSEGVVRMYYLDQDGQEHNKRFFLAGDLFWPVTHSLRTKAVGFSIETLSPVLGQYWLFDEFKPAFKDNLEWLSFNQIWMERLLEAKLSRERDWLQLTAIARYRQLLVDQPTLIDQVPAHHLASYLGITPVTLSRLKKTHNLNK